MNDQELVKRLQCGHGEWANEMTVVGCNLFKGLYTLTGVVRSPKASLVFFGAQPHRLKCGLALIIN